MLKNPMGWVSRYPTFRNFVGCVSVSTLGSNIFDVVTPLYVWDRTHSPISLAITSACLTLPYFVMAPLTGHVVDHFNNRRVMLLADALQVLTLALLLFYDSSGHQSLLPFYLCVFAAKTFAILFETVTSFHLVPSLVPESHLNDANTIFLSAMRFIQIMGPLVGGAVMTFISFRACVWINLFSFGATLGFVLATPGLSSLNNHEGSSLPIAHRLSLETVSKNFFWSIRYVWRSPLFRPLIFTMFFWNFSALVPNTPSLTYYFRGLKGFSPLEYGIVTGLCAVVGFVGFFVAARGYRNRRFDDTFASGCLWQAALATASLAFFAFPVAFSLIFALSRVGSSVLASGSFLLRQTEAPKKRLGIVNSTLRMHFMLAAPLSAVAQGYVINHFGVATSFIVGAAALWGTYYFSRSVGKAYDSPQAKSIPLAAA